MSRTEYRMPSTGIRPGDIVTAPDKRNVQITNVVDLRINYHGLRFPVRRLSGIDMTTRGPVICLAAHKGLWTVTRMN